LGGRRPEWVRLLKTEWLGSLENLNKIDELCPPALPPEEVKACKDKNLAPQTYAFPIYFFPDPNGAKLGTLRVTAVPGQPLKINFQKVRSKTLVEFKPDLYLEDWGYGPPYFHQTVLDKKDHWLFIPLLGERGWINGEVFISTAVVKEAAEQDLFLGLELDKIYSLGNESLKIMELKEKSFTYRPEQPADLWCGSGEPPAVQEVPLKELKYSDLYDDEAHLKIKLKYMKGC
jgi:hypothetical protein